jgi:hypothetical protein
MARSDDRQPGRVLVPGALLLLLLLCLTPALRADSLFLKDGARIDGRIVGQDEISIIIETAAGRRRVPKAQLSRVEYNDIRPDPAAVERERRAREKAEQDRRVREAAEKEARGREKAQSAAELAPAPPGRDLGAIWRAALLPGWGHYYSGREGSGVGIGLGTGALLLAAYYEARAAAQERSVYEQSASLNLVLPFTVTSDARAGAFAYALSENASRQSVYQRRADRSALLLNLAFLAYTVQLAHATSFTLFAAPASSVGGGSEFRAAVQYAF